VVQSDKLKINDVNSTRTNNDSHVYRESVFSLFADAFLQKVEQCNCCVDIAFTADYGKLLRSVVGFNQLQR